jgi:putative membrane protein
MLKLHDLPTLNAILNSISAVLIVIGYFLIRARRIEAHRKTMLAAFTTSTLFLISYLIYHAQVGSVRFQGTGAIRTVYFTILLTHTVLAAVVAPMVVVTLFRGLKGRVEKHRKLARITLPIWLYVSVTGVVVYGMLYHL